MLTILFNWLYALGTILLLGFGIAVIVESLFGYRIKKADSILMAGIIAATVYAQFFSLIYKVSTLANIVLLLICFIILICRMKVVYETLKKWVKETTIAQKIVFIFLVLVWSYFTSRGYIHYDSDLYHGQSIRWLEEYGVVPGLGNLHERFAYNSSFFALSALYSLKFLLGYSMHAMSGFVALVLSVTCMPIMKSWKEKCFKLADFVRIAAIYYLTTITNEVVSPASDYAVMCVVFFIVIKWLDVLENEKIEIDTLQEEKNAIAPYALLCVVGVYALSLKLTAGLILVLLIKPAYLLLKEKRIKEIFLYLGFGLLVALPWLARTVIISGWLFYPFTALDLFTVDWKMDGHMIDLDAAQIKVWGRALYNVTLIDVPITGWFPNWFLNTLSTMEKLLIMGNFGAIITTVGLGVRIVVKKMWKQLDILLVTVTMICCYVFWQTSAPLMRYGYAYVLLLVFVVFGWFMEELKPTMIKKKCSQSIFVLFCLYGIYKVIVLADYIKDTSPAEFYIWQEDYGVYELESYEVNGETFYYPVSGDRTGYASFPASGAKIDLEFRGDTMKDGFRKANQ